MKRLWERHRLARLVMLAVMLVMVVAACEQRPSPEDLPTTTPTLSREVQSSPAPDRATSDALAAAATVTETSISPYPPPPEPSPGATSTGYPAPDRPTATPHSSPESTGGNQAYLPLINNGDVRPTATPTMPPAATPRPTQTPTPIPILDFASIRADLNDAGMDLVYSKIGFHGSLLDDEGRLLAWMRQLDAAGVPFYIKSVDNAEPIYLAQEMMKASGVDHTLVFRATGGVPDYTLPPQQAAQRHWQMHKELFPPELDPSLVWIETVNEVDKNYSTWLAEFALETARLAMADGFRWAAFGWAAGEPEPEHWQLPAMLEFLRLAGDHPDQLAIALHEGSGTAENAAFEYPFRTGRFLKLFQIADQYGIPRPTVLITEFGWEYDHVPSVEQALKDIEWAARLYAPFPQVKGAGIWMIGLGCCFGEISDKVVALLQPVTVFSLTHYFTAPAPPVQASTNANLYRP